MKRGKNGLKRDTYSHNGVVQEKTLKAEQNTNSIFSQKLDRNVVHNSKTILQMVMGYRATKVLLVANYHNVFTHVYKGKTTLSKICRAVKSDERATLILLDSLVALGFLSKNGDGYKNTSISEHVLVKGKDHYIGNNLNYQELLWEAWTDLRGIVKRGKNKKPLEYWLFKHETFFREYIYAMHDIAENPANEIAQKVPLNGSTSLLDIGAGPGSYSLAFLKKNPQLEATLLDLDSTIRIAKSIFSKTSCKKRVKYKVADYNKFKFDRYQYDVALMSHITHNENKKNNVHLFKKVYNALKPGGKAIIHDFMLDKHKTSPVFGALFSVHMLVSTKNGRTYSQDEYKIWLRKAGFSNIQSHPICQDSANTSQILVATRPKN